MHRTAQMAGNGPFGKNGLGFAKLFCGRNGSQNRDKVFLKFGGIRVSAPQEGAGGMRGGLLDFWRRGLGKIIQKC